MDPKELSELAGFLAPSTRLDVRANACEGILQLSVRDDAESLFCASKELEQVVQTELLPKLVRLVGDVERVSVPARNALANLAAIKVLTPNSICIKDRASFWNDLVFGDEPGPLLVNLSAVEPTGPERFDALVPGGVGRCAVHLVLRLLESNVTEQQAEYLLATTRNLTIMSSAQLAIVESSSALSALLRVAATGRTSNMRRDACGTIRHILLDRDVGRVARVLGADGAGWLAASLLLGAGAFSTFRALKETLDDEREERTNMSPALVRAFDGEFPFAPDPSPDARLLAIECLACMTSSRAGREKLRETKVYPALRAYHGHETDDNVDDKVHGVIDALLSEEADLTADGVDLAKKDGDAAWGLD